MRQMFDRRSVLGICIGSAAGAALLASGAPSYAATTTFKADLKGASEVPPNTTAGTGSVTATYDPATMELSYSGSFSGLTGPVMAAHFHGPAEAGKNAGVQILDFGKRQGIREPVQGFGEIDRRAGRRPDGWPVVRQPAHQGESCRRSARPIREVVTALGRRVFTGASCDPPILRTMDRRVRFCSGRFPARAPLPRDMRRRSIGSQLRAWPTIARSFAPRSRPIVLPLSQRAHPPSAPGSRTG